MDREVKSVIRGQIKGAELVALSFHTITRRRLDTPLTRERRPHAHCSSAVQPVPIT